MNYQPVVRALSLVSGDLSDIATQTQERITPAQAEAAHQHLNSILRQLIVATRIGESWPLHRSDRIAASITCLSFIGTSTACRSTQNDAKKILATYRRRVGRKPRSARANYPLQATATYLADTTQEMSEFWAGQIEHLETTAEIFFRLVDKEGGDAKHPEYEHLRATRLQLRFAQDLVTVIQYFLEKEQQHYSKNDSAMEVWSVTF